MTDIEQRLCVEIGFAVGMQASRASYNGRGYGIQWHSALRTMSVKIVDGKICVLPWLSTSCQYFELADPHLIDNIRGYLRVFSK